MALELTPAVKISATKPLHTACDELISQVPDGAHSIFAIVYIDGLHPVERAKVDLKSNKFGLQTLDVRFDPAEPNNSMNKTVRLAYGIGVFESFLTNRP